MIFSSVGKKRYSTLPLTCCLTFALILGLTQNVRAEEESDYSTDTMMTGDWGGLRKDLHDKGLDLNATENSEIFGNTSGGTQRNALYEGRLELDAAVDLDKALGWHGVTAFANAYQIGGRGISGNDLNSNIMTVSNIEATRTTRLYDMWVQKAADDNLYSIRIGQIAADDEFATSQTATTFINSVFGWQSSMATNLPSGGPAYPLATPGVRVHLGSNDQPWAFQTAVFDGNPGGKGNPATPQQNDATGTVFNLNGGALTMNELSYALNGGKDDKGLPGTYKLGFWYHSGDFADLHYDNTGRSLAAPISSGVARVHHGNYGLYGVADQTVWVNADNTDQSLAAFARVFWNPADRKDDVLGLGISTIGISNSASALDRNSNAYNGTAAPVRDYENALELTYQAALTPWLTLQPDFQYIMHPGGNVANPNVAGGTTSIKDAAVTGLRVTVKF